MVVSEKPGAWLHAISDQNTIEETIPLYGRNEVAEAILYLFYEMENTHVLSREYVHGGSISGHVIHVSVNNIWVEALSIPDSDVYVNYKDVYGKSKVVSLTETSKKIYWSHSTIDESQLVAEYSHDLFTLEKVVTFHSESSAVDFEWRFTARLDLADVELKIFGFMEPSLDFRKAFIPGVLEWQNPWDKPSRMNITGNWSVVECPPNNLGDNITATLDEENGMLVVFEFADVPEWLNVGALGNRFIDALRTGYVLGDLTKDESLEISFSILLNSFDPNDSEKWTKTVLKQLLDEGTYLPVQQRDFVTYIEENNIEFVVINSQQLLSSVKSSPILDRVYSNNKFAVYIVRK